MKHKCPICKASTDSAEHADFPFCSERCRLRDLGNWASEKYVVSEPIFNEDEEETPEAGSKTIILELDDERDGADSHNLRDNQARPSDLGLDDGEQHHPHDREH
ncbi:MAG: hypothetical protein NVS9B4_19830 [Candidatus Acidiferrum sp.]